MERTRNILFYFNESLLVHKMLKHKEYVRKYLKKALK